ncbi:restriction endonuclease subunit S [Elizabethkingia anophelis]|uniref:restriction endonuclease subunit S n=1 Tax=Elizabethkingia anophelis TaxID=1117645 RepID=UPI0039873559
MTKIQKDNKNVAKFPNLRFPEFTEEWNREKIASILTIGSGKDYKHLSKGTIPVFGTGGYMASVDDFLYEGESVCIGRKGTINKPLYFNGKFWTVDTLFYTHSFKNVLPKFVYNIFEQINWLKYNEASGVPSLSKSTIEQIDINIPCVEEQQKIATFLSLIDERIQAQNKIIEELKLLKITLRYQLYEQILNHENEYVQVKDALNYEQPTKYLVTNTDYSSDISLIPVLTANKAFVLGYTDEEFGIYDKGQCIIFDDFTMDIKFVNFPFKVKSSAIKILTAKPNVNLKFIFEYLLFLNLSSNEHKRHYISEIETMEMQLPNYIQQTYVADFLASIDNKIKNEFEIHTLLLKQKQYLLANLFI